MARFESLLQQAFSQAESRVNAGLKTIDGFNFINTGLYQASCLPSK
ncbi:MAG TPA: hypothetical protein VK892_02570 [Pyrinomonadaceae bacterium]|nr:hypothetical protein [Pyrinomonadaceae bacterium]